MAKRNVKIHKGSIKSDEEVMQDKKRQIDEKNRI